ncbi:hypothetical protein HZA86_05035 [Candidatus Uhrbacteria bacterium]|nr:hypothetical protein [Candidatus Uhrbacteria bacterium]
MRDIRQLYHQLIRNQPHLPSFGEAFLFRFRITIRSWRGSILWACAVDGAEELVQAIQVIFSDERHLELLRRGTYRLWLRARRIPPRNHRSGPSPEHPLDADSSTKPLDNTAVTETPSAAPSPLPPMPEPEVDGPIAAELADEDDDRLHRQVEADFQELWEQYGGDIDP